MRFAFRPLFLFVAASLALAGCGITGNFRNDPGYAAFGYQGPGTERDLGLSLGPLPLGMARLFMNVTDIGPDVRPMMQGLRAARVYVYTVDDAERVAQRIAATQSDLIADGWFPVVRIHDDGERVAVLTHADKRGDLRGMAVIVQDSEDLVLVNLIGDIHPEQFNAYMAAVGVDAPTVDIDPATLQAVVR
jgi:hypothetical protein